MLIEKYRILTIVLVVIWTIPWKGVALWKAARNGDRGWFIAILLINTLAILEIAYIFILSKRSLNENDSASLVRYRRVL